MVTFAEVVIGFNQTRYDVSENDGQAIVYVAVLQGNLQRAVVVNVLTVDNTTLGECYSLVMHGYVLPLFWFMPHTFHAPLSSSR